MREPPPWRSRDGWTAPLPGLILCATIGLAARFLSDEYGAPVMLLALLLGTAFNFLAGDPRFEAGLALGSTSILRIAVALLGLQVGLEQVRSLGLDHGLFLVAAVAATMLGGLILARLLGQGWALGILSGGSVAICGASAAMAIAAILPRDQLRDRELLLTVVVVTALSTVAMILYPAICGWLDLEPARAGYFLGATIHDVAQVVGAGYSYPDPAGDIAVFTKMLRVALLIPIVVLVGLVRPRAGNAGSRRARVPWFLAAFAGLFLLNSFFSVPPMVRDGLAQLSRALLVIAISSLGVQTSLQQIANCGWRPVLLITLETLLLATLVLGFIMIAAGRT